MQGFDLRFRFPISIFGALAALALLVLAPLGMAAPAAALGLSATEQRWLAAHPVIHFGTTGRAVPYTFLEGGEHRGVMADYLSLLGPSLGVQFELQETSNWAETDARLQGGQLDMSALSVRMPEQEPQIAVSDPLLDLEYGLYTLSDARYLAKPGNLAKRRVGVMQGLRIERLLSQDHPEWILLPYRHASSGMALLQEGKIDALVDTVGAVNYRIKTQDLADIRMQLVLPLYRQPLAIGVRPDWPELRAILNKAIHRIPDEERERIKKRWLDPAPAVYSAAAVLQAAGICFALLALTALWIVAKKNREIRTNLAEVERLKTVLETTSITDSLTGLYNRRYLDEQLKTALSYAKRQQSPLTVALADIDLFKSVNDRFGQQRGDSVLKDFAAIVKSMLRNEDIASRYGGEEFVLILPGTELAGGILCAERLRAAVEKKGLNALSVTVSIGVASTEFYADRTADELIARADKALYAAKDRGRNLVLSETDLAALPAVGAADQYKPYRQTK